MREKHLYILVSGSNLSNRKAYLAAAVEKLQQDPRIEIIQKSKVIETEPAHIKKQGKFLNQGLLIQTALEPRELLALTQSIEAKLGRTKRIRYGPREIDIDIVWSDQGEYISPELTIPHPYNRARSWVRKFVAEFLSAQLIELSPHEKVLYQMKKEIRSPADFAAKKAAKEKITVLTVYDYTMARIFGRTSIDTVLVGDSLGSVIKGEEGTIGVTLDEIIYHAKAVRRGLPDAFITADMPFLSYHTSVAEAVKNAGEIIRQSRASAVKVEGGRDFIDVIQAIIRAGIPVMGHLGLLPQSVLRYGGHKLQARQKEEADRLVEEAKALQEAGVFAIVLEMIPAGVAKRVSEALEVPVIGIGAGPHTDGQVLVLYDMLGLNPEFSPRFLRRFADLSGEIEKAVEEYAAEVRAQNYPGDSEYFN